MATTQIPGRYLYAAEVLQKRHRNSVRALIHAPMLFEVPTAAKGEARKDAVVIRLDRGEASSEISYLAYGGRLYRPALDPGAPRRRGAAMETLPPLSVEAYGRLLTAWPIDRPNLAGIGRSAVYFTDPVLNSYGVHDAHHWPDYKDPAERYRNSFPLFAEENFEGKILRSGATAALARYGQAARDVLIVGDAVYHRAIAPMWMVSQDGIELRDLVPGEWHDCYAPVETGCDLFALHRREDAMAWFVARHGKRPCEVRGAIMSAEGDYVPDAPLARPLQGSLSLLLRSIEANKDYLSADGYARWGRLRQAACSVTFSDLGEVGRNAPALIGDVAAIAAELQGLFLPKDAEYNLSDVADYSKRLRERAEFERGRTPVLSEEDDDTLAAAMEMPLPGAAA